MRLILAAVLAVVSHGSALPQDAQVSVHGLVVDAATDVPIGNATVELQGEGASGLPYSVGTSSDGTFVFRRIPPGRYQLSVKRAGFMSRTYGERRPAGPGENIEVGMGGPAPGIDIAMMPTAAIAGRVFDAQGQPVANAAVSALRLSFRRGNRSFAEVQSTRTDDRGEYRMFWLAPGQYYVSAEPPDFASRSLIFGRQGSDPIYWVRYVPHRLTTYLPSAEEAVPVYYPGTFDEESASPIDLAPGSEIRGIDILAAPVKSLTVHGTVVNSQSREVIKGARVTFIGSRYRTYRTSEDTFEVAGVLPGSYILLAESGDLKGRASVEVRDQDVENVEIPVSPGFRIPGTVVVAGRTGIDLVPDLTRLRVNLRLVPNRGPGPASPVNPSADGSFVLEGATSGDYRIAITPELENAFLQSIRLGDVDVLDFGLHLDGAPASSLEIVVNTNAATVEGIVLDDRGQPVPGVHVAAVPDNPIEGRTDLARNSTTDASGRFRITGIAPGDYSVFAWEDVEDRAWLNAEFMGRYRGLGVPVQIEEGNAFTMQVPVIPFGRRE